MWPPWPPSRGRWLRRYYLWLVPLPITGLLLFLYLLIPWEASRAGIFFAAQGLNFGAVLLGIHLRKPRNPWAWRAIALGLALVAAAGGVALLGDLLAFNLTPPSIEDVLDIGGDLLVIGGLLALTQRSIGGGARAALLDAGILTVGASLVAWVLWVAPLTATQGLPAPQLITAMTHPAIDVLWFGLVVLLFFARGARSAAFWLIVAALPVAFVADAALAFGHRSGLEPGRCTQRCRHRHRGKARRSVQHRGSRWRRSGPGRQVGAGEDRDRQRAPLCSSWRRPARMARSPCQGG